MRLLLTGGCGFIGSHTIRKVLQRKEVDRVVNIDALTYSGNPINLSDIEDERYHFVHASINDKNTVARLLEQEKIDVIIHLAAESHVDRSINSVQPFIATNIDGTRVLLECVREREEKGGKVAFVHISTDEVYGSLGADDSPFTEETPLDPQNPYAATKAAADMLVRAFVNTYGISACITRCSNNYGPNQFPEKLIPLMTLNAINGNSLPVYGDGKQVRDWIHVNDHAMGILAVMDGLISGRVKTGEVINIGADNEQSNIDVIRAIIGYTNADEALIQHVKDRPGHDRRYAMGYEKAKQLLGWSPIIEWKDGLAQTVDWYLTNTTWVNSVLNGEYRDWVKRHYTDEREQGSPINV